MSKQNWIKAGLATGIIPFIIKFFLKNSMLITAISAIPVTQWIDSKFKLTPVLSKIISVLIFMVLMAVSWHCAEVIVVLAAIAFAGELIHWFNVIKVKWAKYYGRNSLISETV